MTYGNYRETASAFQLQDSTVCKTRKAALPEKSETHQGSEGGKVWKGNAKGARCPLSYSTSIDEELLSWLPVSILALQKKEKPLILPHNPCFEASRGCVRQFKERHNLALQKKPSLCQKLPSQHKSKILSFYFECARFSKIGKYPIPLIGNMDKTPVFFEIVPEKLLVQKGQKSVTIRTSGSERRHVTVVLTAAADGFI